MFTDNIIFSNLSKPIYKAFLRYIISLGFWRKQSVKKLS